MKIWTDVKGDFQSVYTNLEFELFVLFSFIQITIFSCCILKKQTHLTVICGLLSFPVKISTCIWTLCFSAYCSQIKFLKIYEIDISNTQLEITWVILKYSGHGKIEPLTIFRLFYSFFFTYLGLPNFFVEALWILFRLKDLVFLFMVVEVFMLKIQFVQDIVKVLKERLFMTVLTSNATKSFLRLIGFQETLQPPIYDTTVLEEDSLATVINEIHQLELDMGGVNSIHNINNRSFNRVRRRLGLYTRSRIRTNVETFGNPYEIQTTAIGRTRFTQCLANVTNHKIVKSDGEAECAICLDSFTIGENSFKIQKCSHLFHPSCILQWLKMQSTCPLCRCDITRN